MSVYRAPHRHDINGLDQYPINQVTQHMSTDPQIQRYHRSAGAAPQTTVWRLIAMVAALVLLLVAAIPVQAQHSVHGPRYSGDLEVDTLPPDDTVANTAPAVVTLRFNAYARLVKLALRSAEDELVNIGFRYSPVPNRVFIQELPELPASAFYAVEWAAIDENNEILYGSFHFSFGPEARKPSDILAEQRDTRHIMVPDYRLLDPAGPAAAP